MNNLKKVGVSALAGSLAMISAQAVEVSWSGDSTVAFTTGNSTSSDANSALADSFGADVGLSVSASGELDNGWTVSTSVDTGGNNTVSSAQLTIGMGDMGTVQFNQMAGAFVNGIDDVLPTAYEETNDGSEHAVQGHTVGSASTSGSISYKTPAIEFSGVTLQGMIDYDPAASAASGGNGALTSAAADKGSATAYGLTIDSGVGLKVYLAYEETESETRGATSDVQIMNNGEDVGVQAVYSMGAVSVGYGEWYSNGIDDSLDYGLTAYSIAFNVNDNLSISTGKMEDEQTSILGVKVKADIKSYSAAYSMGSMGIKLKHTDTDNAAFSTGITAERTEIAVSFAF